MQGRVSKTAGLETQKGAPLGPARPAEPRGQSQPSSAEPHRHVRKKNCLKPLIWGTLCYAAMATPALAYDPFSKLERAIELRLIPECQRALFPTTMPSPRFPRDMFFLAPEALPIQVPFNGALILLHALSHGCLLLKIHLSTQT